MPKKSWRMLMRAPTAAACMLLGASAQATILYDSNFDPALPDFGFSGSARFQLSDSCFTSSGFKYVNTTTSTCTVTMVSAMIHLFAPSSGPPTSTATLDFAPLLPDSLDVWGIDIDSNLKLSGVDTFIIGSISTGVSPFTGSWWLQFTDNQGHTPPGSGPSELSLVGIDGAPLGNNVLLYQGCVGAPGASCLVGAALNVSFVQVQVPEPGTLALILGALGGGWFSRRRKKQAA